MMQVKQPLFVKLAELEAFIRELCVDPEKWRRFYASLPRPTCCLPVDAEALGCFRQDPRNRAALHLPRLLRRRHFVSNQAERS